MVLDLRDNPGGYLDSAVYTASEFLPMNKLVVKQESTTSESKSYYVFRDGKLKDIPLVVLINKGSASASEILSGALRDYKRAKLIGEKSFGKGSVQEALDLKNGAGLHVTVAKWILPNGDWINGKGIEPDVKVQNELKDGETLSRDTDAQLDAAVQELVK
jgi:carboxyl-terminal processing protease